MKDCQPKTGAACHCKPNAPAWASAARFYFQFAADNDRNGNPRRVFAFYDDRANLIGAVDEGYIGLPAWARERTRNGTLFDGGRIPVPASFRRELLAS